jgi:hypothetical protein
MLKSVKQKILQLKEIVGIEITLLPEDEIVISGVSVKLAKNEVVKQNEFQFLHSYDNLHEKVSTKTPVVVIINGKGILQKKIEINSATSISVENILPNANPNQFYIQETTFEKFGSVAVARKDLVNNIINHLKAKGYKVLSVSLGISDVKYLLPYLNLDREEPLRSNTFEIFFDQEKKIREVSVAQFDKADIARNEYSIGNHYVSAASVLAFGACLGMFARGLFINSGLEVDSLIEERSEFVYFKYFDVAKWSALLILFFTLFINFFVYSHYFYKNNSLQSQIEIAKNQAEQDEKLQVNLDSKETFLHMLGWDRSSKLSFFADRIAGMVPDGIVLTDMKLNPLNGRYYDDNLLSFMHDTIEITGTCFDPGELTIFGNNLKNVSALRQVNINNYKFSKEDNYGVFSMGIITH